MAADATTVLRTQSRLDNSIPHCHRQCSLFCYMASYRETGRYAKLTDEERAKFAVRERTVVTAGWHPLATSEELNVRGGDGYFGVAYYKLDPATKTSEVIIAHRGTCFDEQGNILADIAIAERHQPEILNTAFKYVTKLFGENNLFNGSVSITKQFAIQGYTITKITHTGFSLGGFIAAACVALTQYPNMEAISFDAPGIDGLDIANRSMAESRIVNYLMPPNLINTCNKHIGLIRVLNIPIAEDEPRSSYEIEYQIMIADLGILPKRDVETVHSVVEQLQKCSGTIGCITDLAYTLEWHSLNKIIDYMSSTAGLSSTFTSSNIWPVAINEMIYGPFPQLDDFSHFGEGGLCTTILSTIAVAAQVGKHISAGIIWEMTKKIKPNGEEVGIIGVKHKRNNFIFTRLRSPSMGSSMLTFSASSRSSSSGSASSSSRKRTYRDVAATTTEDITGVNGLRSDLEQLRKRLRSCK